MKFLKDRINKKVEISRGEIEVVHDPELERLKKRVADVEDRIDILENKTK